MEKHFIFHEYDGILHGLGTVLLKREVYLFSNCSFMNSSTVWQNKKTS